MQPYGAVVEVMGGEGFGGGGGGGIRGGSNGGLSVTLWLLHAQRLATAHEPSNVFRYAFRAFSTYN